MNEILDFLKDYAAYINYALGATTGYMLARAIETHEHIKIKSMLEKSLDRCDRLNKSLSQQNKLIETFLKVK